MKIKIVLLILSYIVFVMMNKAYYRFYPTIPIYPNSESELVIVKQLIANRTKEDIDLFDKTNISVSPAFVPYVNETKLQLDILSTRQNDNIHFFKYLINRIRPWQLDNQIVPIDKSTAMTPAYPAGHAYQAYLLAKYLSKKYPDKKKLFYEIAHNCDMCRVKTGLHYPSDGIFAKNLVEYFN